ncbi:ARM repeat-containing protein [Phellopilus nigrolimitatus]|nr:ARM repeat-containing protein [Phellopilus nigrolimitatus]
MNAAELLTNSLSPVAQTRQDATAQLEAVARDNYPGYVATLSSELANEAQTTTIRNAAGIALKNALSARLKHIIQESTRQLDYSNRWLALPAEPKEQVKQDVLRALASPSQKAGGVAAQVVAAIAAVELPNNQWPEIIEILLRFMDGPDNVSLKIATLQAIGYICETIKPEILSMRSNEILTAVIHGARKEEPSVDVQLAAINALYNSLEFVRDNFEREGERNYIMQVVCEATQNPSVPVQVGAFECLVRIMSLYYDKMAFYMERALFGLTVLGMKHPEESISLQAVEFWSTVCEEEIELAIEASEAAEYGEAPETESKNFAKIALPEIIPVLLGLLTRQDEDADEDEWNVSMAAATCLALLAQTVADAIVPAVIPFIEANIKAADWHQREAAVMTFGSILDGPDPTVLTPLVTQALPILVDMTRDENLLVKDTVAWTLGRICDLLVVALKPDEHLHPLISALVNALEDKPRIVANCCWALMNLSDQLGSFYEEEGPTLSSGPLAPYYEGIVTALLRVTDGTDNESNFRTSAYEALASYVTHAGPESITVVQNTALATLSRMEQLLGMQNQLLGIDDRNNWNELQSNLCSVLISVVRKLGDGIEPLADQIMTVLLGLIQSSKTSTVLEDAFLVVGTMAAALEVKFSPYIQAFLPFLYPALKAHEDTQLCTVAIGVIGDISRALGEQSVQYAGPFMSVLLESLSSETLNRNVKIPILSCFGDIALAIGPGFEPYLDHTMNVLRQAGSIMPNPMDYELVDYVSQLREGILEAYTGTVTGLKNTEKVQLLLPYVQSMLELVQRCLADEERPESVVRLSLGLVGDLADAFPNGEIKQLLLAEWLAQMLRAKTRLSSDTKKTLRWAREMVKRATA